MLMRPEQIASLPIWAAGLLMGGLAIFAAGRSSLSSAALSR